MKKILPIFFRPKIKIFVTPIIFGFIFCLFLTLFAPVVSAQTPTPTGVSGKWVSDSEVTFVGKTGARSGQFLDWTLKNYQWLTLVDGKNPLIPFWITIRNIIYAIVALFVLGTAFILIITRGQSVTVMRFIPRFVFIVVLITLSFSLVQFFYQINDIVQDFFLKVDGRYISTQDLLYIGFDYETFLGFRRVGLEFEESAFISLLLVRLTAITYYVMTGLLLVRKIILWFFIIISPVFPLLLFYRPIRNTAKIWIGEFFRWLLYAPLFAIFLHGLVAMWRAGVPLPFDFSGVSAGKIVYPTAINILLGGPGQAIGINNSVNLRDTFALYVVALLMLWVVILLPFLLLKIFLDYLASISLDNSIFVKQFMNRGFGFLPASKGIPPSAPPTPPGVVQPTGASRTLPFMARKGAAVEPVQFRASVQASIQESADILRLTNLSIPRMRDIARYETSLISKDVGRRSEVSSFHTSLQKIANPNVVATPAERERFSTVRQKLLEQKQKGNPIASSILNASQVTAVTSAQKVVQTRQEQIEHLGQTIRKVANPNLAVVPSERERFMKVREKLLDEKQKGNSLAASLLDAGEQLSKGEVREDQKTQMENKLLDQLFAEEQKGNEMASEFITEAPSLARLPKEGLPLVNKVQEVSLEDYEEVRKLWTENYQTLEPPKDLSGQEIDRREWISNDIEKINQAVTLLTSLEPKKVNEGMEMVANILPFLLIGGFSKTEVISYLKAKLEAGKSVLVDIKRKEEEEESMVGTKVVKRETPRALSQEEKTEEPVSPSQGGLPDENLNVQDTGQSRDKEQYKG